MCRGVDTHPLLIFRSRGWIKRGFATIVLCYPRALGEDASRHPFEADTVVTQPQRCSWVGDQGARFKDAAVSDRELC